MSHISERFQPFRVGMLAKETIAPRSLGDTTTSSLPCREDKRRVAQRDYVVNGRLSINRTMIEAD